jgi:hypothetical protein
MRTATMPGAPSAYIEASYRGHKVPPGKYTITLKAAGQSLSTPLEIQPNPLYNITQKDYTEYHTVMSKMEAELTRMHNTLNSLYNQQVQLEHLIATIPNDEKHKALKAEGQSLLAALKAWDEEMVQRKSKAYDDVENFPNKFTASYMFLINQTESEIPK